MTTPTSTPPMTPERWRAVNAVLNGALARGPEERAAFVRDACDGDDALRREVESLLAAHDDAGDDFLERPAIAALASGSTTGPEGDALARASMEMLGRASMETLARALAGRYTVEREIARGGMATVYLARDLRHGRRVAVKVLRADVAAAVGAERFLAEIRVTASLQHPHVLPLFDSGSADGLLWYVMPFVEGETLRSRLAREGALPVSEAVRLAREVADALDHAHAHGVVHRDVKPENVLLQDGHALVADFGIALALERAGDRLTRTGLTLGTPRYMAPEQASGEREIDARVDVYAVGAVLYEMLAGAPPAVASLAESWRAGGVPYLPRQESAPPLAAHRSDVPPSLDAAVRRALATRPDERFPSAAAFASALGAAVAPPRDAVVAPAAPAAEPARRGTAVRAAVYAAAVVGFVAGIASGWSLARSSLVERWTRNAPAAVSQPPVAAGLVDDAPPAGDLSLAVVDRAGRPQRTIPANRPWTPRFSPDGRRVAYGAFGDGRSTSDLWVTELSTGATRRLTDDDADANDPQWSADGATIAYSLSAPGGKDLATRRLVGDAGGAPRVLSRPGVQFPSDWLRDGSALLVTEDAGPAGGYDVLVQPTDGSPARPYAATPANETAARVSPDGRWVAYTSDASGRAEVYVDAYPAPGRRVRISTNGGEHPVWRGEGRELYYWRGDALVAVPLGAAQGDAPPSVAGAESVLFRAPYQVAPNTMYDVSPDGQRFVIVRHR